MGGTSANRDFAALLDDLFAASGAEVDVPPRPSIPFDLLALADGTESADVTTFVEAATAEYLDLREAIAELDALLSRAELEALLERAEIAVAEELKPVDPASISRELGLDKGVPIADLGRLRRAFAFRNHPDRVAPHLRRQAMLRMQVANVLIDEAEKQAAAPKRR